MGFVWDLTCCLLVWCRGQRAPMVHVVGAHSSQRDFGFMRAIHIADMPFKSQYVNSVVVAQVLQIVQ